MMIFSNNLHSQYNKDFSVFDDKFSEANNLYNNSKYEKSIEYYTRGSMLKLHCQKKLDEAVLKLEEIKVSSDGKVSKKKANDT